ncbi:aldehyde ferredoxin oxidoreductase N-terminal domain-containing protein [Desulfitibacter alkalitolerans]|uniref:aldehyde ferredoxin oxidoreductase N-terminal domain-containing protein n=1 Tax=Desulfitibacter alkalitolerans TaxID=264641 RepID=UPI000687D2DA|nr:aldehyde ferredoxin oxidoreductase N-terminal domain-containing protein [Desulfitibacter alkalitolerans]
MIIRICMTNQQIWKEKLPEDYSFLGGRSLTSQLLLDEVDPVCHPLGPENKLIIAPGLLGGTSAPCSGRISVGAKSPLTGGIKESNAGGTAGRKLARLGIRALIIEGQPQGQLQKKSEGDAIYILKVTNQKNRNYSG